MVRPKGLREAEEVVPKLGIKPGRPALRVGDVTAYDRAIEHLTGHLDRSELDLPLRYFAGRYGIVLCFALEPCDAGALLADLVRVSHADGAVWVAVWKRAFERAGAPSWEEVRSAGLTTGWVDNKVLSLGDEVYATRFIRRRVTAVDAGPQRPDDDSGPGDTAHQSRPSPARPARRPATERSLPNIAFHPPPRRLPPSSSLVRKSTILS